MSTSPLTFADGKPPQRMTPGSAAERWAMYVLRGCACPHDPKTMELWARSANISGSGLAENCRLIGLPPRQARDFMRTLRALLRSRDGHGRFEVLLDISDRRTLTILVAKTGLAPPPRRAHPRSIDEFFDRQQFVPADNEGVSILRSWCAGEGQTRLGTP